MTRTGPLLRFFATVVYPSQITRYCRAQKYETDDPFDRLTINNNASNCFFLPKINDHLPSFGRIQLKIVIVTPRHQPFHFMTVFGLILIRYQLF